ncbi:MAG TPA: erythromycin esterase family protein [Acidimicrobiales bacterium]|nr:erythromycin esterase family protein [Acidimicrobiales bacterium]
MNSTDLDEIGALVGDATAVGIGESLHAGAEFYQFRHATFQYLVEAHGFRAFALESGFPEGLLVDAWIKGESDLDLDEVLRRGFTYNMGCCEEFAAQLEWMRDWNASHPDDLVHYFGADVPGWAENADSAFAVVEEFLTKVDPDAPVRGSSDAQELADWLALREPDYGHRSSPIAAAIARRAAETGAALARLVANVEKYGHQSPLVGAVRDLTMAQTVVWLTRVLGTRVAFAAHNAHLQRVAPWGGDLAQSAGGYLAHMLGDGYRPIATTMGLAEGFGPSADIGEDVAALGVENAGYGPAEPGTVDYAMSISGARVLDLRKEKIDGDRMRVQSYSIRVDAPACFDGLVHFDRVTHMHPRSLGRGGE